MANGPIRASNSSAAPLRSEFAGDADMTELIEYFVSELGDRTQTLADAFEAGNLAQIRSIAHQLKGAAGGYGFAAISATAAELEHALKAGEPETSALAEKVEALLQICRRAAV